MIFCSFVHLLVNTVNILSILSPRASSPGRSSGGPEEEGELATTTLEFESRLQFPRPLSCQISDKSARSGNEREYKQTLKTT